MSSSSISLYTTSDHVHVSNMGSADVDALIEEIMKNGEVTLKSKGLIYHIGLLAFLVILVAGTTIAVVLALNGELFGWVLAVFLGVVAFIDGAHMFFRPYTVLTPEGATSYELWGSSSAKWTDFEDARVRWVSFRKMVMVKYSNSCESKSTMGKAVRAMSFDLAVIPDTLGLKAEDYAELMNKMRERALGSATADYT